MPSLLFTGMDIKWVEMGEERRAIVTVVQCSGVFLVPSASICVHYSRLDDEAFAFWSTQE